MAPYTSQDPWIIHTCFEQAFSTWVKGCQIHGDDFVYVSPSTALLRLGSAFEHHLDIKRLKEVKDSYNRILAKIIVYPAGSTPPNAVAAGRPALIASSKTSNTLEITPGELSRTTSTISNISESSKKRDRVSQDGLPNPKVTKNPPKLRYCYANLASVFKVVVTPKYTGGCQHPEGKTCMANGGNTHFTTSNLPSLSEVISTIRSFSNINASTTSLVEQLEAKDK
jgi:hypothetical protein